MNDFCLVCKGMMYPYFMKDFAGEWGIWDVEYWLCGNCGLVVSKTHLEMSTEEWEDLNTRYHSSYLGTDYLDDDVRWLPRLQKQAESIAKMTKASIIPRDLPWIDFGCGDGKLADLLSKYGFHSMKFDRYMSSQSGAYLTEDQLSETKYSLVINTSVFEHCRSIDPLDEIAGLVSDSGVLAIHTLVRESIPNDPNWFYLLPVHSTFFTNHSMQILFERWSFKATIYDLEARMWFFIRSNVNSVKSYVEREDHTTDNNLFFKEGFVDFWK